MLKASDPVLSFFNFLFHFVKEARIHVLISFRWTDIGVVLLSGRSLLWTALCIHLSLTHSEGRACLFILFGALDNFGRRATLLFVFAAGPSTSVVATAATVLLFAHKFGLKLNFNSHFSLSLNQSSS